MNKKEKLLKEQNKLLKENNRLYKQQNNDNSKTENRELSPEEKLLIRKKYFKWVTIGAIVFGLFLLGYIIYSIIELISLIFS